MSIMKKLKDMDLNASKVSEMRIERGLTLEQLAEKIGCDTSTVSLWEAGKTQPGPSNLKKLATFFGVPMRAILAGLMVLAMVQPASAQAQEPAMDRAEMIVHMTPYWDQVVGAIYRAEGGAKTRHPFGILSVKCSGYEECREVCFNTVRNNYFRWIKAGRPGEYLEFLARRYAPVGAENDPTGLNRNWLRNVSAFVERD